MKYKDFAIGIAKEAGKIIRDNFKLGMERDWKPDNSPVTKADLDINRLVIESVKKEFPDHGVRGEEESYRANSEYLWVCDPIDGTIPFAHGIPICTFSLALVKNGKPIVGVIHDPFLERLFSAEEGKGTFLNEEQIYVSKQKDLANNALNLENFENAKYQLWELEKKLSFKNSKVLKLCSTAYACALVACGEFIASIFPHTGGHDIAAAKIIVEEAGGKVTDLFGQEQRYDQNIKGAIVSNGIVHKELVELTREFLSED